MPAVISTVATTGGSVLNALEIGTVSAAIQRTEQQHVCCAGRCCRNKRAQQRPACTCTYTQPSSRSAVRIDLCRRFHDVLLHVGLERRDQAIRRPLAQHRWMNAPWVAQHGPCSGPRRGADADRRRLVQVRRTAARCRSDRRAITKGTRQPHSFSFVFVRPAEGPPTTSTRSTCRRSRDVTGTPRKCRSGLSSPPRSYPLSGLPYSSATERP